MSYMFRQNKNIIICASMFIIQNRWEITCKLYLFLQKEDICRSGGQKKILNSLSSNSCSIPCYKYLLFCNFTELLLNNFTKIFKSIMCEQVYGLSMNCLPEVWKGTIFLGIQLFTYQTISMESAICQPAHGP